MDYPERISRWFHGFLSRIIKGAAYQEANVINPKLMIRFVDLSTVDGEQEGIHEVAELEN